jgi:hypothetical protein
MLDKDTKRSSLFRLTIKCGKMLDKDGKYYKTLRPIALNKYNVTKMLDYYRNVFQTH